MHLNFMAKAMHDDPQFDLSDLAHFSANRENALLDMFLWDGRANCYASTCNMRLILYYTVYVLFCISLHPVALCPTCL